MSSPSTSFVANPPEALAASDMAFANDASSSPCSAVKNTIHTRSMRQNEFITPAKFRLLYESIWASRYLLNQNIGKKVIMFNPKSEPITPFVSILRPRDIPHNKPSTRRAHIVIVGNSGNDLESGCHRKVLHFLMRLGMMMQVLQVYFQIR
mmetsp:Transcript_19321/g.39052  ORF Transcript_19321/g.39052 Transcript_19321/m.39052 type:complete len:151 (+) Transcript_19321:342-794(+)